MVEKWVFVTFYQSTFFTSAGVKKSHIIHTEEPTFVFLFAESILKASCLLVEWLCLLATCQYLHNS